MSSPLPSNEGMSSPRKRKRAEELESLKDPIEEATDLLSSASVKGSDEQLSATRQSLERLLRLHYESEEIRRKEVREFDKKISALISSQNELSGRLDKLQTPKLTRAASSLTPYEALAMFNLSQAKYKVEWQLSVEPPAWVLEHMNRTRKIVLSKATRGEAFARLLIDQVLMAALEIHEQQSIATAAAWEAPPPAPLRLALEDRLEKEVLDKGKTVTLQGIADYAIYYDNPEADKYATGLVAIEAKKERDASHAMGQLIAYMGIIHSARKNSGKQNRVVWGFASDGYEYIFCRIDQEGQFDRSNLLSFDERDRGLIFGLLCGILKAAALSSPTTSPIKDSKVRQEVLLSFGSPERRGKFDYGVSADNDEHHKDA